jgi:hypothetical protein
MSGGGGGGGDWRPEPKAPVTAPKPTGSGGGSGGEQVDPCVIEEVTTLNSVSAVVLRGVRLGDLLDVDVIPGPPPRLVAKDPTGNTVGSITSRSMLQFIACIQNGRQYVAEVLSIQGGTCTVRVTLK